MFRDQKKFGSTVSRGASRRAWQGAASFFFLLSAAWETRATLACPRPCLVRQPDSTVISVYLRGDENLHWHEDAGGYTILREAASGFWVYAVKDVNGRLTPGVGVVGRDDPGKMGLKRHLLPDGAEGREVEGPVLAGEPGAKPAIRAGRLKNLVLLVDFPDKPHTLGKGAFRALFNEEGYGEGGAAGSVRDYFKQISYQALTVDSVVLDWITLDHGYAYYGADQGGVGRDIRSRQMVEEALAKAEARGFDFSQMDADNDGEVDSLTVVHAGGGQEYSLNDTRQIWSHQWEMTRTVTYDGTRMKPYTTVPERRGFDGNPDSQGITRIGVICHEMGHLLGLPDLYDFGFDSQGVGNFCVMGLGCWNGSLGAQPAHPNAWCKVLLGWVTPDEVSGPGTYSAPRVEDNPKVYRLSGQFPRTQYFLIENRQGHGFDAGLPGKKRGLLIWHVDETVGNNNNQNHYKVDLEEAGGIQGLERDDNAGNDAAYFRKKTLRTFNAETVPDNRSYAGVPLGQDVVAISKQSDTMTFDVVEAGSGGERVWASSEQGSGHGAAKARDGDPATRWIGAPGAAPWSLTFDLGRVVALREMEILFGGPVWAGYSAAGSRDLEHWVDLQSADEPPVELRYLYLFLPADSGKSGPPAIREIMLKE